MHRNTGEKIFIGASIALACAVLIFISFEAKSGVKPSADVEVRANLTQYNFINPLLFVKDSKETSAPYTTFEAKLDNYINQAKKDGNADSISVYYRDLNSGRWTGVNETMEYIPGSMLKVYLLMDYMQIAQYEPSILSKKLTYTKQTSYGKDFVPEDPLVLGHSYTIEELLNHTIIDSDNESAYLLLNNLSDDYKKETLKELDLPEPLPDGTEVVSPQVFSHFFRTLYNATFLSRDSSERALEFLTHTTYKNGLVAGVPETVKVAHKFGEFVTSASDPSSTDTKELHDCGIVYYPNTPYLLCVMTKGSDFNKLESAIKDISAMAYSSAALLAKQ